MGPQEAGRVCDDGAPRAPVRGRRPGAGSRAARPFAPPAGKARIAERGRCAAGALGGGARGTLTRARELHSLPPPPSAALGACVRCDAVRAWAARTRRRWRGGPRGTSSPAASSAARMDVTEIGDRPRFLRDRPKCTACLHVRAQAIKPACADSWHVFTHAIELTCTRPRQHCFCVRVHALVPAKHLTAPPAPDMHLSLPRRGLSARDESMCKSY